MSGTLSPELVSKVSAFAEFHCAYRECSDEVRQIVDTMVSVVRDPRCDEDERFEAILTIAEALFPKMMAENVEMLEEALAANHSIPAAMEAQEGEFSRRVSALMAERGITQQELAERAGIGQSAVSMLLSRQCRPQMRTVKKFAEALGVSTADLFPPLEECAP